MFGNLKCKTCGSNSFKKINNDTYECKYCGFQVRKKFAKCPDCETEENDNIKVVDKLSENSENQTQDGSLDDIKKEKNDKHNFALVKLLLCIFLGQFGVHRFLEGKIFSGLLFVFTHGFFGIGILCDIIRLAKELSRNSGEREE